jgi:hypothetical protein
LILLPITQEFFKEWETANGLKATNATRRRNDIENPCGHDRLQPMIAGIYTAAILIARNCLFSGLFPRFLTALDRWRASFRTAIDCRLPALCAKLRRGELDSFGWRWVVEHWILQQLFNLLLLIGHRSLLHRQIERELDPPSGLHSWMNNIRPFIPQKLLNVGTFLWRRSATRGMPDIDNLLHFVDQQHEATEL